VSTSDKGVETRLDDGELANTFLAVEGVWNNSESRRLGFEHANQSRNKDRGNSIARVQVRLQVRTLELYCLYLTAMVSKRVARSEVNDSGSDRRRREDKRTLVWRSK
jgi:hypothetical protein